MKSIISLVCLLFAFLIITSQFSYADRTKPSCTKGKPWDKTTKTCARGTGPECPDDASGKVSCTPYQITCLKRIKLIGGLPDAWKRETVFEGCGCNSDAGAIASCPKETDSMKDCELSGWIEEPTGWEKPTRCNLLPTPIPPETATF